MPVCLLHQTDLTGQNLARLQNYSLNGVGYIVIDEFSMFSQVTFGWIDRCCKQATGLFEKVVGGKSLILIGDPAQLPSLGDKPLYHDKPSNDYW